MTEHLRSPLEEEPRNAAVPQDFSGAPVSRPTLGPMGFSANNPFAAGLELPAAEKSTGAAPVSANVGFSPDNPFAQGLATGASPTGFSPDNPFAAGLEQPLPSSDVHDPGFFTSLARGTGQIYASTKALLGDDEAAVQIAQEFERRYPVEYPTIESVFESPGAFLGAIKEKFGEFLPSMASFATGAGLGYAAGAGIGGALGGPLAPLTAALGGKIGSWVGAFTAGFVLNAGETKMNLAQEGLEPTFNDVVIPGLLKTGLDVVPFFGHAKRLGFGKAVEEGVEYAARQPGVKAALMNALKHVGKETGGVLLREVPTETLQEFVDIATEHAMKNLPIMSLDAEEQRRLMTTAVFTTLGMTPLGAGIGVRHHLKTPVSDDVGEGDLLSPDLGKTVEAETGVTPTTPQGEQASELAVNKTLADAGIRQLDEAATIADHAQQLENIDNLAYALGQETEGIETPVELRELETKLLSADIPAREFAPDANVIEADGTLTDNTGGDENTVFGFADSSTPEAVRIYEHRGEPISISERRRIVSVLSALQQKYLPNTNISLFTPRAYNQLFARTEADIMTERSRGKTFMIKGADGTSRLGFAIRAFEGSKDKHQLFETIGHEFGHAIIGTSFERASNVVKRAVLGKYRAWLNTLNSITLKEFIQSYGAAGYLERQLANIPAEVQNAPFMDYYNKLKNVDPERAARLISFHEYAAQGIAHYLSQGEKVSPAGHFEGAIKNFFKKALQQLRQLYYDLKGKLHSALPMTLFMENLSSLQQAESLFRQGQYEGLEIEAIEAAEPVERLTIEDFLAGLRQTTRLHAALQNAPADLPLTVEAISKYVSGKWKRGGTSVAPPGSAIIQKLNRTEEANLRAAIREARAALGDNATIARVLRALEEQAIPLVVTTEIDPSLDHLTEYGISRAGVPEGTVAQTLSVQLPEGLIEPGSVLWQMLSNNHWSQPLQLGWARVFQPPGGVPKIVEVQSDFVQRRQTVGEALKMYQKGVKALEGLMRALAPNDPSLYRVKLLHQYFTQLGTGTDSTASQFGAIFRHLDEVMRAADAPEAAIIEAKVITPLADFATAFQRNVAARYALMLMRLRQGFTREQLAVELQELDIKQLRKDVQEAERLHKLLGGQSDVILSRVLQEALRHLAERGYENVDIAQPRAVSLIEWGRYLSEVPAERQRIAARYEELTTRVAKLLKLPSVGDVIETSNRGEVPYTRYEIGQLQEQPTIAFADEDLPSIFNTIKALDRNFPRYDNISDVPKPKFNWIYKYFLTPLQIAEKNLQLPGVGKYFELVRAWWQDKIQIVEEASRVLDLWKRSGLSWKQEEAFGDMVHRITLRSMKLERQLNPVELEEEWTRAGLQDHAGARELYAQMRGIYEKAIRSLFEELKVDANRRLRENATDARNAVAELEKDLQALLNQDFFPLNRYGKFWVLVRAPREMVTSFDSQDLTLKANQIMTFETFESRADMERQFASYKKAYGQNMFVSSGKLSDTAASMQNMPPHMIKLLKDRLSLTEDQNKELDFLLYELAPGQSMRKSLLRRRGVLGYSKDARRGFAAYFMHFGNYLARIRHAPQMLDAIKENSEFVDRLRKAPGGEGVEARELNDYMNNHFKYLMDPGNELANLRSLAFVWYLGYMPKSAMVNLTQVPLVTLPYLGAKYGDGSAVSALTQALGDIRQVILKGTLPEWIQQAIDQGIEAGFLNESLATEIAATAGEDKLTAAPFGGTNVGVRAAEMLRTGARWGAWMFQKAEMFNRYQTFLAGARLEMAKQLKDAGVAKFEALTEEQQKAAYTQAYLAGRTAVESTQYEYARWNRPVFMRGKRSALFVFWQYMQNTAYFAFASPNRGARLRFAIMMLLVAGLSGYPFADDVMDMIDFAMTKMGQTLGWKNPKTDVRLALREYIKTLGLNPDYIMHGLSRDSFGLGMISAMTGLPLPSLDMSGSLSMGRIIPGVEPLFGREGKLADRVLAANADIGGAFYSIPLSVMQALSDDNPDRFRAWERAMPSILKSISKAGRFAEAGAARTTKGAELVPFDMSDPRHVAEVAAQALGFTPTRLSREYELRWAQKEHAAYYATRRQVLLWELDHAISTRDAELIKEARDNITTYNRSIPTPRLRITAKDISKSLKARRTHRAQESANVPHSKRERALYREIAEAYEQ